jgi:DHA2 family multidrug resistance protein
MTLFGFAALLAPVVGPTVGGWITDSYSWRWVFYINVPVGLLALAACYALLRDPDYLTKQRMELRKRPFRFDSIGLSLLVIVMVSWEVMLSKGQEWDWLSDPFWRVQTLATSFAVGLIALILWELRHPSPVVNFRPMRERNFSACCLIIFCAYMVIYAASTSLPGLLQSLFGYDALNAGLVMSPAGFFAVVAMPVVGRLLGRGADARWVIAAGLLIMAAGNYWMSQMNLDISPGQVVWPRVVLVLGLSICFAPANVAAYLYTSPLLRGAAVGLLSLLRNEGGSVGTSLAQTMQERRDQFHTLRLGESLDSFNAAVVSFLEQARALFLQQTGDPVAAQQLAWQALENLRQQQASALAYFDVFLMLAVVTLVLVPVVLLMKRSVVERPHRCRMRHACELTCTAQTTPGSAKVGAIRSFLTFGRWVLGQSLKHQRHKGDAVGGAKKSRADGEQLAMRGKRNYVAITDGRKRHYFIVEVVNQRAAPCKRWLRSVGQEIIFDSKDRQNAANKKRPQQERNPDVNRLPLCTLQ